MKRSRGSCSTALGKAAGAGRGRQCHRRSVGAGIVRDSAGRPANGHVGRYAAVLCLGAVIRGETSHDQHINRAVSLAISQLSLSTNVPVLFGVLTCETMEQAIHRAGGNVGNKGAECAEAALHMVGLLKNLPNSGEHGAGSGE